LSSSSLTIRTAFLPPFPEEFPHGDSPLLGHFPKAPCETIRRPDTNPGMVSDRSVDFAILDSALRWTLNFRADSLFGHS
jgi:hypothetical protein